MNTFVRAFGYGLFGCASRALGTLPLLSALPTRQRRRKTALSESLTTNMAPSSLFGFSIRCCGLSVVVKLALFASAAMAVPARDLGSNIMLGMPPLPESNYTVRHEEVVSSATVGLPASFDARDVWGSCIHGVLNQGVCGSCWAFAATECLSDRLCIESNGTVDVVLSPGDLLACEKLNLGCTCGSLPQWAWSYLQEKGVVSDACVKYTSGHGDTQKCTTGVCTNSSASNRRYYAATYKHCGSTLSPAKHVAEIMKCVMDGPVDATFNVYSDFHSFTDGVYTKSKGASYKGLHSVKVVGFGHDNATGFDYWTVQAPNANP